MQMLESEKIRKVVNFDFDTNKLKKFFADYTVAYGKIRKTLEDEGFEHRQGSGYVSREGLDSYDVILKIERIVGKQPWLAACVNEFDVSDIPLNMFSLKDMIQSFSAEEKAAATKE